MYFKKNTIKSVILYVLACIVGFAGMLLFASMLLGNETANVIVLFIVCVGFFMHCVNAYKMHKEYEAYQARRRYEEKARRRAASNRPRTIAPVRQHPTIVIPAPRPVVTSSFYDYEADC